MSPTYKMCNKGFVCASGVARGPRGPCTPKLLVNVFFLQWIDVVRPYVLWMCKQTCQVCRNFRESPEMAGGLQVPRKCKKISRNGGHLIDLYLQLPEKNSAAPPPHRIGSAWGKYGNFCYNLPPPNVVGFRRSRKIYRVASAGWPPQTKILATPLVCALYLEEVMAVSAIFWSLKRQFDS